MRVLCTGDLHLGASPDLGAAPGDRLRDQGQVWLRICRLAIENEVDALLFAGDAFHRRRPTPSEIVAFRGGLELLNNAGCDVIAIAGNHDVEAAHLPSGLETTAPHALYEISRRPELFHLRSSDVVVATLPWTPPGQLVAARGGGDRDSINDDVAQLLLQSAAELRQQIPDHKQGILLAHWSVSGASLPTGLATDVLREPVLPTGELEQLGFDAIVLGHIHRAQLLSSEDAPSPIFYVGSPCMVDWGEAEVEHGVWILEDETTTVFGGVARFEPIKDRPFVTIDADISGDNDRVIDGVEIDETDAVAAFIAEKLPLEGAVVRLRYRASADRARRIDHNALRGFVEDAGGSKLVIRPEILRADRARVEGVDESLTELEALQRWSDVQHDLDAVQRERLATLTTQYLEAA